MSSWKLRHMESLIFNTQEVEGAVGLPVMTHPSADAVEIRHAFMGNLFCSTPLDSQVGAISWT